MVIVPNLKVGRFADLNPGEIFIFTRGDVSFLGLKGIDPKNDNDEIIALLVPKPPSDIGRHVIDGYDMTVVSFGYDYVLRLPNNPSGWSTSPPPGEVLCIAIAGGKPFVRANLSPIQGAAKACWIAMSSGILECNIPPGRTAYALEWEFACPDPPLPARTILSTRLTT